MSEKVARLVVEALLKCGDAVTTARLGFAEGRIELDDVVKGLDPVMETLSRLVVISNGESIEGLGSDPVTILKEAVDAIRLV